MAQERRKREQAAPDPWQLTPVAPPPRHSEASTPQRKPDALEPAGDTIHSGETKPQVGDRVRLGDGTEVEIVADDDDEDLP